MCDDDLLLLGSFSEKSMDVPEEEVLKYKLLCLGFCSAKHCSGSGCGQIRHYAVSRIRIFPEMDPYTDPSGFMQNSELSFN